MPDGASTAASLTTMLTNAPLPSIIEKLGVAIADAQYAMDHNSVRIAKEMARTGIEIGENSYNMLGLGFTPAFYHFTEANVEAKLAFSMTQSSSLEGSASVGGSIGLVAVSVEASYSRKFSMSAEGSSSVSARLVSLPPPAIFEEILRREYQLNNTSPANGDDPNS